MSVTRKIVEYIIGARFEDIPPAAVARTKEFILDEIGNALGGSVLRSGKIIIEWGKQLGGVPEATIISNGIKVPVGISSGVNTQLCMGLELMETYKNRGHPCCYQASRVERGRGHACLWHGVGQWSNHECS